MKVKVFIFLSLIIILPGCRNELELKNYPDPYLESFFGRKVKSMLSYDPNDSRRPDSLRMENVTFDRAGNIIHLTAFMSNDTMVYDNRHFIIRKRQRLDAPANFVITYHFDKDGNLIQVWHDLKHRKWEFAKEDLTAADKDTVKFELDKEGKILSEQDSEKITVYHYNSGKLISKETSLLRNGNEPISMTLYTYSNNIVERIDYYRRKELCEIHYFSSDGLLDSTKHLFKGQGFLTKYRYTFFN